MVVFTILSGIARASGGIYDPIFEQYNQWKDSEQKLLSKKQEEEFARNYLSPLMFCGAPKTSEARWMIKCLSNDQTGFSGFTSLLETCENSFGYSRPFRLMPTAVFVEPFAIKESGNQIKLEKIRDEIANCSNIQYENINRFIKESEELIQIDPSRQKGKSPVFFYSFSDIPFQIPVNLYDRLVNLTEKIVERLCQTSQSYQESGDLERAINSPSQDYERQFFTGSVDWMILGESPYLIDIGSPAVGLCNDIYYGNIASRKQVPIGFDSLSSVADSAILLPLNTQVAELGFFAEERKKLLKGLREKGVEVREELGEGYEAEINGKKLPVKSFDYITRNQDIRYRVLEDITSEGFNLPKQIWLPCDYDKIRKFTEEQNLTEGIIVKKKMKKVDYFKPLVCPVWLKEACRGDDLVLYEQFVPGFVNSSILEERKGKRCFEIRLYFAGRKQ